MINSSSIRASAFIAGIIGAGFAIKRTCAGFLFGPALHIIKVFYIKFKAIKCILYELFSIYRLFLVN